MWGGKPRPYTIYSHSHLFGSRRYETTDTSSNNFRSAQNSLPFEGSERNVNKKVGQTFVFVLGISVDSVSGGEAILGQQVGGDFAEIPDDAEPEHDLEGVISYVDLPPEEALAGRGPEVLMIVLPAFP